MLRARVVMAGLKVDKVGGTVEREGCDVSGRQDVVNTHPAFWRSSERAIVLAMML